MSFKFAGTFTLIVYGPGFVGSPTSTARRAGGGNAGNGFQSMSSGRTDLKSLSPGWWLWLAIGGTSASLVIGVHHRVVRQAIMSGSP